ncbi:PREDICTED: uncharacterized protein LOC109357985 [Lupinus angustifolius]|uniref:uncharacterized protein LOC109357985 n=1 Tax=Lupinus angustifolius TaxID=3871 RepID=UPI00092F252D|nr:PREDICTED: uncharacterized protein LOC109357985 [Lupinus angustifolius]
MSTSNGFAMNLPILDGKNCDHWNIQMKAIFGFQECLDCVDRPNFEKISAASSSKEAWKFLDKCYFGGIKVKKGYGEQTSEQSIVEKILKTLAARFDHFVVAIEESKDLENFNIDELQGSLEAHEQRFLERVTNRQSQQALSAQFKRRNLMHNDKHRKSSGRWQGEKKYVNEKSIQNGQGFLKDSSGNQSYDAESKNDKRGSNQESRRRKKDKSRIQYFNCKSWGHFASECKLRRRSKEVEARLAKDEDLNEEVLLMAECEKSSLETSDSSGTLLMVTTDKDQHSSTENWYLDTGCSNHMTGHKEWFLTLDDSVKTKVKFAYESFITAKGI